LSEPTNGPTYSQAITNTEIRDTRVKWILTELRGKPPNANELRDELAYWLYIDGLGRIIRDSEGRLIAPDQYAPAPSGEGDTASGLRGFGTHEYSHQEYVHDPAGLHDSRLQTQMSQSGGDAGPGPSRGAFVREGPETTLGPKARSWAEAHGLPTVFESPHYLPKGKPARTLGTEKTGGKVGRPPKGERAMTDVERKRRQREGKRRIESLPIKIGWEQYK
jgi:hypothetical protein